LRKILFSCILRYTLGVITARQLAEKYRKFFEERGHKWIPSSPLVPEGDSSTLFISAGMHPLVPYLLGETHPLGKRLVDVQECLRTDDINEVGDTFHHTWFEMLGNWSLGDYFKKESIGQSFEFLTKHLNIDSNKLSVTCFAGDSDAPKDEESAKVWESLGIPKERIYFNPKKDNWWELAGETSPCGPDTEIFFDTEKEECGKDCRPGCSCGKYCEIWNNVFMEYIKKANGGYEPLKQKNVDTGMGVERTLAVLNGFDDDYLTDVWQPIIGKIEEISGKKYEDENVKPMRIIADHLRAAVFVIVDGVVPSNKTQGYVLRRLIRRSIRQGKLLGIKGKFIQEVAKAVLDNRGNYAIDYPELEKNEKLIFSTLADEEEKFLVTIEWGLKEFKKLKEQGQIITGMHGWNLYQSFGFPPELTKEEAEKEGMKIKEDFDSQFKIGQKAHQKLSKMAAAKLFKGGLGEQTEETVKYHTATHLLQAALRVVLGEGVRQIGSAITAEKMRFDFTYPKPLMPEQLAKIEGLVNEKIKEKLAVKMEVMPFKKAVSEGALTVLGKTYPEEVKVYSIDNPLTSSGQAFSKEVCGGPHIKNTGELGEFKIIKEESCGAGKRRIYAVLKK